MMGKNWFRIILFTALVWQPSIHSAQCDPVRDSLVMVDIFQNLSEWDSSIYHFQGWNDPSVPLAEWPGIVIDQAGCIDSLELPNILYTRPFRLPSSIGELSELTYLHFGFNWIDTLPESIGQLSRLEEWIAVDAGIELLPVSIGDLQNLRVLDLTYNVLSTLPESIGDLGQLKELHLGENRLEVLPESIGNLRSLEVLFLIRNQLTALPESIGNLENLFYLACAQNLLTQFPESLVDLSNLEVLYAFVNQIEFLPKDIGRLKRLRLLNLRLNDLRELPGSIGELDSLAELTVSANLLEDLPKALPDLPKLRALDLRENRFTFEDLEGIRGLIDSLSYFRYTGQEWPIPDTSFCAPLAGNAFVDLGVDAKVVRNQYKWYKDGQYLGETMGNNRYRVPFPGINDEGAYYAVVTNPDFPDLVLESNDYRLRLARPGSECLPEKDPPVLTGHQFQEGDPPADMGIIIPELQEFDCFPIPADQEIHCTGVPGQYREAFLISLQGQRMEAHLRIDENQLMINVQELPEGLYVLCITSKDRFLTEKLVIGRP